MKKPFGRYGLYKSFKGYDALVVFTSVSLLEPMIQVSKIL